LSGKVTTQNRFFAMPNTRSGKGKGRADPPPALVKIPIRTIKLFCWILGVSNNAFSVKIEDNETVSDLKKAIVTEKPVTFADIDADQLELWKVSSFLRFDYFMLTILLQGIHRGRQESRERSHQTRVSSPRCTIGSKGVVGGLSATWPR
jgi:Crinkler effector protein N-terminal domain